MSNTYFEPMRGLTGLSARTDLLVPSGDRAGRLRLRTQVRLRWVAVLGQAVSVLFVWLGLGFPLPVVPCLAVIACSALLNLVFELRSTQSLRLTPRLAIALLVFDVVQLAALLFLTGGAENPFVMLMVGPVVISATTLPALYTVALAALALVLVGLLVVVSYPLPWQPGELLVLPDTLVIGNWVAVAATLGFAGSYTWRVAQESRELANALSATELALEREQHLSALDGLAAAAAHELGTPLATIALTVKEMERAQAPGVDMEDIALIREQSQRCREILRRLTSLSSQDEQLRHLRLRALIDEVAAPHRDFGVSILSNARGSPPEPIMRRNAGVLHGLGNLVENAVDFARASVELRAFWDDSVVVIEIIDDGPGFPPALIGRIGEPYISRRGDDDRRDGGEPLPTRETLDEEGLLSAGQGGGLGLGLFIAKTLLERSGAEVEVSEDSFQNEGSRIRVSWPRRVFER